jgi:hypothetical protein
MFFRSMLLVVFAGCAVIPVPPEDTTPVATLAVTEQTADGWCARLALDNRGPSEIDAWVAVVDIHQDELVSVYGADVSANGSLVTLYSLAPIPADSIHDVWVCATSWHGAFIAPELVSVDW